MGPIRNPKVLERQLNSGLLLTTKLINLPPKSNIYGKTFPELQTFQFFINVSTKQTFPSQWIK